MLQNADRRKQKIRQAMMAAAYALIIEKGYDAVTVTDIAARADYGRSTFYLHFADKEALVWDMLREYMQATDATIAEDIEGMDASMRLWQAWYRIFSEVEPQRLFFQQLNGELSRRIRLWQREYLIEVFEAQLTTGYYSLMNDVPPAIGARFIVGSILEILEYALAQPDTYDALTYTNMMFRLVFRQSLPSQLPAKNNLDTLP